MVWLDRHVRDWRNRIDDPTMENLQRLVADGDKPLDTRSYAFFGFRALGIEGSVWWLRQLDDLYRWWAQVLTEGVAERPEPCYWATYDRFEHLKREVVVR